MRIQPPKVDDRNASEIAADVRRLLAGRMPLLQLGRRGPAITLVNIFARFGELIIDRINRAPDKNLLAFLDLLGISPIPQQAARAPVTFYLAAGRINEAVVPKLTQVAAEPGKGEQTPIVYETERELVVVSTRLESLIVKYGERDQYADYHAVLPQIEFAKSNEGKAFAPPQPDLQLIPHVLYVGLPFPPTLSSVDELRLSFVLEDLKQASLDARTVRWESVRKLPAIPSKPDGEPISTDDGQPVATVILPPAEDSTENLSKSGDVVFANLQQWSPEKIDAVSSHWLCCRLQTPISYQTEQSAGAVRAAHLPKVKALNVSMRAQKELLVPGFAFTNNAKLDLTKEFYPFGEKPKFGDTFYIACDEAFSLTDAVVTLKIALTNPATGGAEPPIPRANPKGIRLKWEFWDGVSWTELGTSDLSQAQPQPQQSGPSRRIKILDESHAVMPPTNEFVDTTRAFSESEKEVSFRFIRAPKKVAVNGQQGFWIRVRIIAGDYGKDAYYEKESGKYVLVPGTVGPPSISKITVSYKFYKESPAQALCTYNDGQFAEIDPVSPSFSCFLPLDKADILPTVYFGFLLPEAVTESVAAAATLPSSQKAAFPARSMSIYVGLGPSGPRQQPPELSSQIAVEWEFWNGTRWVQWTVRDETLGLRRSGMIRFLAPSEFSAKAEFGQKRYWLRIRQHDRDFHANLGVVALNTAMAAHCLTGTNEVLGTSNGQPNQKFRTARGPLLEGQRLEIRELTFPSAAERHQIMKDVGDDAIQRIAVPGGKGDEIWVRWHEVPNFYDSRSRDRHYLLNRISGEVSFGDGSCGMIPPVLGGNIRMTSYRSGGGAMGNKPALTIKQLKSAVPYIQSAVNWVAADGGADMESETALLERGPTELRHAGRAITAQDIEDLAKRLSPEVARAMCVPLHDLVADPSMTRRKPGALSVIIVPESSESRPYPSSDLLLNVQSALQSACPPAANVRVLGPEYVAADVKVNVAVVDPDTANDVKLAVTLAIQRYLHPLTGGMDAAGWDFGRVPRRSELFTLIEGIAGVHHVIDLTLSVAGSTDLSSKMGRFLICTGRVEVSGVLEDDKI